MCLAAEKQLKTCLRSCWSPSFVPLAFCSKKGQTALLMLGEGKTTFISYQKWSPKPCIRTNHLFSSPLHLMKPSDPNHAHVMGKRYFNDGGASHFDCIQRVKPKFFSSTQCKSTRASQQNGCGSGCIGTLCSRISFQTALRSSQVWCFRQFWVGSWLSRRSHWR